MIPITPETIKATYGYLLHFPPFSGWKMYPARKLTFSVVPYTGEYAQFDPNKMELRVSAAAMSKQHTLMKKMAHEMIHVHEHAIGRWSHTHDTAFFFKCRDRVCRHFDFDPLDF
jgi:hypothetical protein